MGVKQAPASSGTKALSPRNYDNSVSFLGNDLTLNLAPKLRRTLFGTVIALLVAAGPVAFLVYFLPQREVLRIVGPETRRPLGSSKSDTTTHDVFYIYAEDLETKNPVCFTTKALAWYGLCRLVSA
jgi:hypothetical protein